jgi:hypothetical protein
MVAKIILVAALAGMLSGCVVLFNNPLPASQPIGRDQGLLGKWEAKDEYANSSWLRFEMSANQMNVFGSGLASHDRPFRMVTTNISGRTYMILGIPERGLAKYYMVASYSINGDKLTVCPMDFEKVATAINDHKIKGTISSSTAGGATINESSNNIVRLLKSPDAKDLFTCLPEFTKATSK